MPHGIFYTQLAAYSDKSSVGWLCTNLQTKLFGTATDKYNQKSIAALITDSKQEISTI